MMMTTDRCDSDFLSLKNLYAAFQLWASCPGRLSHDSQIATMEDIEGDSTFDLPQQED